MKTGIYLRVSTNDQTTENQLPDLEALASRRGFEIVTTFSENVSAVKTRPEFVCPVLDHRVLRPEKP